MFAVIRIRGRVGVRRDIEDTLKMLKISAVNNCVILPETPEYNGMVEKTRDFITWGEITKETLVMMLKKRLKLKGNKKTDENTLKKITGSDSFENFADSLLQGKSKIKNFEEFQPLFRLTPPSKGFKSTKEQYPKGDLGYRGKEINELLERMI